MKEPPTDEQMREAAERIHGRDGECEIDDNAVVSRGDDPGAYVQAWVWVYYADVEGFEDYNDEEEAEVDAP